MKRFDYLKWYFCEFSQLLYCNVIMSERVTQGMHFSICIRVTALRFYVIGNSESEDSNETSDSIKFREFLDRLSEYWLLKKTAPWSKIQVDVFWVVATCSVAVGNQHFGGLCCLRLQTENHFTCNSTRRQNPDDLNLNSLPWKSIISLSQSVSQSVSQ